MKIRLNDSERLELTTRLNRDSPVAIELKLKAEKRLTAVEETFRLTSLRNIHVSYSITKQQRKGLFQVFLGADFALVKVKCQSAASVLVQTFYSYIIRAVSSFSGGLQKNSDRQEEI